MRVKLVDDDTDIVVNVQEYTNANALTVAVVDSTGAQVTSFGAGIQYTEAATDASITGTAMLWEDTSDTLRAVSAAKPLPVTVISGGTSGTEYTEGATDTTITGTAIMWEDTSDTLRAVSAAKPLPIGDAGGSLTVDNGGTFAVQAAQSGTWNITDISGTVSLPTGASTLAEQQTQTTALQLIDNIVLAEDAAHSSGNSGVMALAVRNDAGATTFCADQDYSPIAVDANGRIGIADLGGSITVDGTITEASGATIATNTGNAATSLAILDDWDESDRAKVNPIVGNAGVTGNTGTVDAGTQRVVLATNVGLPAGTAALGSVNRTVAATATLSQVADSATNVTLIAANASRRGATVVNDSTEILYLKFGATATTSSYTYRMIANATLEFPEPMYVGIVDGIWASGASGSAVITEIT